jgi:N-acetylmuramoyl-L-alanine amidase
MFKNITALIISALILLFISLAIYKHNTKPLAVLIQAGHEGRSNGNTGTSYSKYKEVEWNIIVANEVSKTLNKWGIDTKRVGAKLPNIKAKVAISIHFDGATKRCSSGASIGYANSNSKELANRWKKAYKKVFPFKWHKDNYTKNLSEYYGFYEVKADKFLVLELGEISCKRQIRWLEPRLKKIAHLIAATIAKDFGINAHIKF